MQNEIPVLYTELEKKILPVRERIFIMLNEHPDGFNIYEIIGLLESIKREFEDIYL
jgi:hypothetical protein